MDRLREVVVCWELLFGLAFVRAVQLTIDPFFVSGWHGSVAFSLTVPLNCAISSRVHLEL